MRKLYGKLIILFAIVAISISALFYLLYFILPPVFNNSYQKGYNYQYHAIEKANNDKKIIVLGGSYMTFATDSKLLSKLTNRPSYTLGIHSGMGMCYIIESVEKFISQGDIVIYSFRPFEKNDYGMDLIYLCFEGDKDMFLDFFSTHSPVIAKTISPAIFTKLYNWFHEILKKALNKAGLKNSVWVESAFDEASGNLIYPRPVIDPGIPEYELKPRFEYKIEEIDDSCIKILNDLDSFCKEKGAFLCITWSPVYEGSVLSSNDEKSNYEKYLASNCNAPIISTLNKNEFPEDCLYNGALHMNDKGMEQYTKQMYEDLKAYLGNSF